MTGSGQTDPARTGLLPNELLPLFERELELDGMLENAGVGLQWLSPNGTILWANGYLLDLLGYAADDYIGHNSSEFHADAGAASHFTAVLAAEQLQGNNEVSLVCKDGRIRTVVMSSNELLRTGESAFTRCFFRDVSDRVAAQTTQRQAEERYRTFIHNSSEGIWRFELDHPIDSSWPVDEQVSRAYDWGYLAECNDAMARMYGYETAETLIGTRLADLFVRSDPNNEAFLRAFFTSGYQLRNAESHERDVHGTDRYFLNSFVGVLEKGLLVRAWGTQSDVTRQRQMENALRASEERFSRFMRHLPGAAWIKTVDGYYAYANPEAERVFRVSLDNLRGKSDFEVFPHETARQFASNDQRALAHPTGIQTIETLAHEDGMHESVVSKFPIPDERGTPTLVGGIAIDITDQRRIQAALRESEERLRMAADAGKVGLWDWDILNDRIVWSDRIYEFHGLPRGDFGGGVEDFAVRVYPDDRETVRAAITRALEDRAPYAIEFRIVRPNGQIRWLSTSARVLYNEAGRPVRMLGAVLDTTERRDYEERLRRSNEELEEFAFVASHDVREPLRMVNTYTELLLRRAGLRDDADLRSYRRFIERGVQRMEELISDLLAYSRVIHSDHESATTDLNVALEKALRVLESQIRETGAEIISDPLPVVEGEETQLEQVFQNLISNSLKYRQSGRQSRVRIGFIQDGPQYRISVADNGIGFDPKYSELIFGLFKRLHHNEYPGTGLGLAICKRIIERCGGRIWAESTPGSGSTFSFTLPQVPTGPERLFPSSHV